MSQPWPRNEPMPNQRAFDIVHTFRRKFTSANIMIVRIGIMESE